MKLIGEATFANDIAVKLKAIRIIDQIDLNGILNENEWIDAEKIDNFTQRELNEGKIASEKTEVAVLYSNSSIFNRKSPPAISKYSVGFAKFSRTGFQTSSLFLFELFNISKCRL